MASVNKVVLIGNVGKDPEVRYTQAGDPIASFSLATSERWTDKAGQKQEKTEWHKVVVFGKTAKFVGDNVTKGVALYVEGSMSYGQYTTKDGAKVNTAEVHVKGAGRIERLSWPASKPTVNDPEPAFQATDEDVPF